MTWPTGSLNPGYCLTDKAHRIRHRASKRPARGPHQAVCYVGTPPASFSWLCPLEIAVLVQPHKHRRVCACGAPSQRIPHAAKEPGFAECSRAPEPRSSSAASADSILPCRAISDRRYIGAALTRRSQSRGASGRAEANPPRAPVLVSHEPVVQGEFFNQLQATVIRFARLRGHPARSSRSSLVTHAEQQ
jgi:hypothetical protein